MEMHSVDSTESRENKENPVAKCYPNMEVNPGPLTLLSCIRLSELNPLFAGSLRPLEPYISCSVDSWTLGINE